MQQAFTERYAEADAAAITVLLQLEEAGKACGLQPSAKWLAKVRASLRRVVLLPNGQCLRHPRMCTSCPAW